MKTPRKTLMIAGAVLLAATFSTATLAHDGHGHGHWKHERFENRWERRDFRHHDHGHHLGHRHFDERVVFIREPAPVYYVPAPVFYRPARPTITISTPDIVIPF